MKPSPSAMVAGLILGLTADVAPAQDDFWIFEHAIAAGGVTMSRGGDFALSGTIGQPAPLASRGGSFTLAGGFWRTAFIEKPAEMPVLTITRSKPGVTLAWTRSGGEADIFLETSVTLGNDAEWFQVGFRDEAGMAMIQVNIPDLSGTRYFRLRRRVRFP